MKLTDAKIRALKPRETLYRVADGRGLALEVTPTGGKHWRFRYRWVGKAQMMGLGTYPVVSLAEARERVHELHRILARGENPGRRRLARVDAQAARDAERFSAIAGQWLEERRGDARPKTFAKMEAILNGDLIPRLGAESIRTLSTPQAVAALQAIQRRAPHMAQKAMTYLHKITLYAIQKGLREDGKTLSLKGVVKLPKAKSVPAATDEDALGQVMLKILEYPDRVVRAGLLLTAYSVLRPSNAVGLRWSTFQEAKNMFAIPAAEMKTGQDYYLPVTRQISAILDEAKTWKRRRYDYVLPALSTRTTPHLHRDSLSKALREIGLQGTHVPHGFRAAFRSLMRERFQIDIDVLEAQLAHSKGDATARAYDRTRFLEARRNALQLWADLLDTLADNARCNRDSKHPVCAPRSSG